MIDRTWGLLLGGVLALALFQPPVTCVGAEPPAAIVEVEKGRILAAAEAVLAIQPISITNYRAPLSEGGPNDFFSMSDYFWPDPQKPDGKPYVRRDGESYPGNFNEHRLALMRMRDATAALAAAYKTTHDERYAAKAVQLLKVFFVDPATRMTPNLQHAQVIVGQATPERGIGIIDTLHLVDVPLAILALEGSKSLTPELLAGLKQWFRDYATWLRTSPKGKNEAKHPNNHAVAYWLQIAAFSRLTGDQAMLAECRRQYKEEFVPKQMAADGSFPAELQRTKPYAYSIFQLDNMASLCQLLSVPEDNLWRFEMADGRGIRKAMAYLYPYLADKTKWPLKPDIQAWEEWPVRQSSLLFAGLALGEESYLKLWRKLSPDLKLFEIRRNNAITQPLLWLDNPAVPPDGNAVIRSQAGASEIVITTTRRLAGAIHSLKWNGQEFINSTDHGRQLQSAASFDCASGKPFWAECFNPTEAGSRADGAGAKSSSRLLEIHADGAELRTTTQMAFWLAPGEKSSGRPALNDQVLSSHLLSKQVHIGYKKLSNVIEYQVEFTVPEGERHAQAQFEALTGYMPPEFERFWKFLPASGKLQELDDGPGEQACPVVFSTVDGSHAMGIISPDQPSPGCTKAGYGRFRFKAEKVVKWNCVFRIRDAQKIPGEHHFRMFVAVGTLEEVRLALESLTREFAKR